MPEESSKQRIIVEDIHMSFSSMVFFMVKRAIASIPAVIILFIIGSMLLPLFLATFN